VCPLSTESNFELLFWERCYINLYTQYNAITWQWITSHHHQFIIIKFSFIWRRNKPSVTNAEGIYKYKLMTKNQLITTTTDMRVRTSVIYISHESREAEKINTPAICHWGKVAQHSLFSSLPLLTFWTRVSALSFRFSRAMVLYKSSFYDYCLN